MSISAKSVLGWANLSKFCQHRAIFGEIGRCLASIGHLAEIGLHPQSRSRVTLGRDFPKVARICAYRSELAQVPPKLGCNRPMLISASFAWAWPKSDAGANMPPIPKCTRAC